MAKVIDLNKSVYEIVSEYPEVKDIMQELGFSEIAKSAMLHSVGRIMTIPKGAEMKNIAMDAITEALASHGFEISGAGSEGKDRSEDDEKTATASEPKKQEQAAAADRNPELDENDRNALIKSYLKRLNEGEALEEVRADFAENFADVDPAEIMKAEQELIAEGAPLEEVQQLCDVHSALFHGATREEKIANTEAAVQEALKKQQSIRESISMEQYEDKTSVCAELTDTLGHPLNTYVRENEALMELIERTRAKLDSGEDAGAELAEMRQLSIHYASKGDLIYPVLNAKYEITGPSNIMWTVDDEIRDEMGSLEKETNHDSAWNIRLKAVMERAEEMVYKEENILFPICAVNFSEEEWKGIYRDSMDYDTCFGVERAVWAEAEAENPAGRSGIEASFGKGENDEIVLPGGHMSLDQLRALLNTIPGEITFVDSDNINRFFNEGPKLFKRPSMAIDREVWTCHPPKIEPMVRAIIEDFRNHVRDEVPVWMDKAGRTMLVRYMAVRDAEGNYVGTLEFVQDMEFAKEHFAK